MRLIVFDVDGTLVDSQHRIVHGLRHAFAEAGRTAPPRETLLSIVGLSLPEAIAALAPDVSARDISRMVEAYLSSEGNASDAPPPLYEGAREAVERLSREPDTLLGIATGKGRRGLDALLADHALADHFVTLQTADGHPSKPHPAMLRAALAEAGCEPDVAVMVGDTEFDMAMGRAAGVATIGVTWGYHAAARLRASGAGRVVDDFADIHTALNATLSAQPRV